jgi:hypothetical protein
MHCAVGKIQRRLGAARSHSARRAAACKRKTYNGWTFWRYERALGDWVLIDELRKR